MKVSVIIPCYNSSNTILDSIKSITNQSYKNIELLIVDDGSQDNSLSIINSIDDPRIRILQQPNKGPGAARNKGILNATGDYVMFCDSDDYLDPGIIESIAGLKDSQDYDVVLFRTQKVSPDGRVLVDNKMDSFVFTDEIKEKIISSVYNKFLEYNRLFGFDGVCGKFIKRSFLIGNNILFPENIFRFEDAYFCKKLFQKGGRIKYMDVLGYYYVQNPDSLCHKFNPNAVEMYREALNVLRDGETNNDFYIKTLTTITECEVLYFYNREYKQSFSDYRKEFIQMLKSEPFCDAISKVDTASIPVHYRAEVFLLKRRMILAYTAMKKLYLHLKKSI